MQNYKTFIPAVIKIYRLHKAEAITLSISRRLEIDMERTETLLTVIPFTFYSRRVLRTAFLARKPAVPLNEILPRHMVE